LLGKNLRGGRDHSKLAALGNDGSHDSRDYTANGISAIIKFCEAPDSGILRSPPHIMTTYQKTELVPRTSGVYLIRCRPTGKIYVGSAVDLRRRWGIHQRTLRKRAHHNDPLQAAWNLFGEAEFEFEILEYVPKPQLLTAEQKWIDQTRCTDRTVGFNVIALASTQNQKTPYTWDGFHDPEGNAVSIVNLTQFCRDHDLDFPSMHRLARGVSKLKSHKGWTHVNSVRQRSYIKSYEGFVDPQGNPAPTITNLAEFCRAKGLDNTHMVAVANGRIVSHRGWTHLSGKRRKPAPEYTGFVAPGGAFTIITNLTAFCRACDLSVVHMHQVKSGKRPSHKGWTWRVHDESEIAQWRRVAEVHESPHLGNEPVSAPARPQPG